MGFRLKQFRRSTDHCSKKKDVHLLRGLIPKVLKCHLSITFNDQLQYKKLKNGVEFVFCPDSFKFHEEY